MGTGNSIEIRQPTHDLVNLNANLQIANADLAVGNPAFVSPGTGSTWTAVSATHDNLNLNANLQVANADNAVGNPAFVSPGTGATWTAVSATHGNFLGDMTVQLADADITRANPMPVAKVSDGATTAVVTLTDANETTLIAAPAASNHLEWLGFSVQMADTTPAVATLTIRVGTAGTTKFLVRLAATDSMGVVVIFPEPVPITSATLMSGQLDIANTVIVNMVYKTKAD